ncbi:phage major capsid protein [Rhodovulum marinum]|uniref:HK97 family phage major capsid protein n=1 Tax=Rhodovulum marinum TaxID=320662 RepID=A0A4R2Q615_9RHOB|nr:phage major capsid protein [Rhodovulum marinum]TCP43939.1 HK97 family phage major capsid protein [Rhodovulum marinum]
MSKIKELREEAKRLETEARSKLDAAGAEKDADKAAAFEAEFDSLMDRRDSLVKQADRLERSDEARREMEEIEERGAREARESRRPTAASDSFAPGAHADSDEYREAFRDMLAAGGDLSAIPQEARDMLRANFAKIDQRAQAGATGATGGFTVPTTLAREINIAMAAYGPMWDEDVATVMVTGDGAPIVLPKIDDTAGETAAHTEGNSLADDGSGDVTVTKEDLLAYTRATPWITWSFELAQDSGFSWEAILARLIAKRAGRKANTELTVGTGVGQPLGFMTASVEGKLAASNSALTFDEVIDLFHSVDPAYRMGPKVGFQMHDQTVKHVRKLKNANGDYIWSDGDVTRGVPPTLLGKPARFNQAMDQIGASKKPIAFGDFGEFYVRKVGSPMIGIAREKFFPNLGIAGVVRYDGGIGTPGAIKHLATPA